MSGACRSTSWGLTPGLLSKETQEIENKANRLFCNMLKTKGAIEIFFYEPESRLP